MPKRDLTILLIAAMVFQYIIGIQKIIASVEIRFLLKFMGYSCFLLITAYTNRFRLRANGIDPDSREGLRESAKIMACTCATLFIWEFPRMLLASQI